jgi:hypothetical protein
MIDLQTCMIVVGLLTLCGALIGAAWYMMPRPRRWPRQQHSSYFSTSQRSQPQ